MITCPVPDLQNDWEFKEIVKFYNTRQDEIKNVAEIGSFFGATLFYWMQNPHLNKIASIDWPIGENDHRYWKMIECRELWSSWVPTGAKFADIVGNSHDPETIKKAIEFFGEDKVDFLVIDGDHSTIAVEKDWDNYSPLVRDGGYIAFHDTIGYKSVAVVVDKLKKKHPYTEIYNPVHGWAWTVIQKL